MGRERTPSLAIDIAEETRENFSITERGNGAQFLFCLPGPRLRPYETAKILKSVSVLAFSSKILCASGSLPRGVRADAYARIARLARQARTRMAVDASGAALTAALRERVWLVKPNLSELREVTGARLADIGAQAQACVRLVERGSAEIVVLTLGGDGALLVTERTALWAIPPPIAAVSSVGAGDSFMGALLWALNLDLGLEEALRYGAAAGAAALSEHGTELAFPERIAKLLAAVRVEDVRRGGRQTSPAALRKRPLDAAAALPAGARPGCGPGAGA